MASNTDTCKACWQTDWGKCCLCQTDKKESLSCPLANPSKKASDGYSLLARNIPRFHSLNQLPIKLDPAWLDDGSGIDATLRKNKVQYRESCRLLFNNTKLQRAEKRSTPSAPGDESRGSKIPRRVRHTEDSNPECFLCEEEGDNLREAMTMKLNKRLNECATTLGDRKLLAKLSTGDVITQEMKYHPLCLVALYNRE